MYLKINFHAFQTSILKIRDCRVHILSPIDIGYDPLELKEISICREYHILNIITVSKEKKAAPGV